MSETTSSLRLGQAVPDFELDLSRAQPAEAFAARFAQAVPQVDKAPTE